MPRTATYKNEKNMISWRTDAKVHKMAVAIAEGTHANKQTTFDRLFRNGIAVDGVIRSIKAMLASKAEEESETGRDLMMAALYEATDGDAMAYLAEAVREKMERDGYELPDEPSAVAGAARHARKTGASRSGEVLIG